MSGRRGGFLHLLFISESNFTLTCRHDLPLTFEEYIQCFCRRDIHWYKVPSKYTYNFLNVLYIRRETPCEVQSCIYVVLL